MPNDMRIMPEVDTRDGHSVSFVLAIGTIRQMCRLQTTFRTQSQASSYLHKHRTEFERVAREKVRARPNRRRPDQADDVVTTRCLQTEERTGRRPVVSMSWRWRSGQLDRPLVQMNARTKRNNNLDAPIGFRPTPLLRAAIVKWAEGQADKLTLSQAICRLVERGLTARGSDRSGDGQKRRARKMAGDAIDNIMDAAGSADDRITRKRHLLDGPDEFSRVRLDRIKRASRPGHRRER